MINSGIGSCGSVRQPRHPETHTAGPGAGGVGRNGERKMSKIEKDIRVQIQ